MKQLTQKLDDLFSEFDSGEPINLPAFKRDIMNLAAAASVEYDKMTEESAAYRNLKKEATELRSIILEDCRAKLILINENDVEGRLEGFESRPIDELRRIRELVLKRFDSKFRLVEKMSEIGQPEQNTLLRNLHAYQS